MSAHWSRNQMTLAKTEWDRIIGTELVPDVDGARILVDWWNSTGRPPPGQSTLLLKEGIVHITQDARRWTDELVYHLQSSHYNTGP